MHPLRRRRLDRHRERMADPSISDQLLMSRVTEHMPYWDFKFPVTAFIGS